MITGYDHLLFLFGVIFFLSKFKDIVKFITAFTIGHSITLIFATCYEITASYYLIDAVIALSVCSTSPSRFKRISFSFSMFSGSISFKTISVAIGPGASVLTIMLGASSRASALVRPFIPALAAT